MGYPNIIRGYYHTQKGYYHNYGLKTSLWGILFSDGFISVPGSGAFWSPVRSTKPWTGSSRQERKTGQGTIFFRKSIDFCHDIIWGVAVCHVFSFQTTFGFGLAEGSSLFFAKWQLSQVTSIFKCCFDKFGTIYCSLPGINCLYFIPQESQEVSLHFCWQVGGMGAVRGLIYDHSHVHRS